MGMLCDNIAHHPNTDRAKLGRRQNFDGLSVRVGKTVEVAVTRYMCAQVMLFLSAVIIVLDYVPHTHTHS